MFVRWKRYNRKPVKRYRSGIGYTIEERSLLAAVLVESSRVDGKPRQRVVRYLGSIREDLIPYAYRRLDFWRRVGQALDELNLPTAEHERVEQRLDAVVARPTPEDLAGADEEVRRLDHEIKLMLARAGQ